MGVEPTLDREAGRRTVLKTVERLLRRAPGCPIRVPLSSNVGVPRSWMGSADPQVSPVWQQIWQQIRPRALTLTDASSPRPSPSSLAAGTRLTFGVCTALDAIAGVD
jgi:hypothetical protein